MLLMITLKFVLEMLKVVQNAVFYSEKTICYCSIWKRFSLTEVEGQVVTGGELRQRDHWVSLDEQQERTYNNHVTPLVKNLADNIQNPMNLVEEVNDDSWVRGGAQHKS